MTEPFILNQGPDHRTEVHPPDEGGLIALLLFHGGAGDGMTYTRGQARDLADALVKACNTVAKEAT